MLLFTGTRFVQTLEGSAAVIDPLMTRIGRDRQHGRLVVIDRHEVPTRNFKKWAMAYSGPSTFVERIVTRAVTGARLGEPDDVRRLLLLIHEFAAPGRRRPRT